MWLPRSLVAHFNIKHYFIAFLFKFSYHGWRKIVEQPPHFLNVIQKKHIRIEVNDLENYKNKFVLKFEIIHMSDIKEFELPLLFTCML